MEAQTVAAMEAVPEDTPEVRAEDMVDYRDAEVLEFLAEVDAILPTGDEPGGELAMASRYLAIIRKLDARYARVVEASDAIIDEQQAWRAEEARKRASSVEFLQARIRLLFPGDPERFKGEYGTKSLALAGGARVGFRQKGGGIEVTDERAALQWAEKHCPSAYRTIATLSKAALAEHAKKGGECEGPGWAQTDKRDEFFVKAGGGQ